MWSKGHGIGILCSLATFLGGAIASGSPPVTVRLSSAWPAPPLLLEIIETIALEQPNAFFQLLDVLTAPEQGLSFLGSTDEALHEAAFQITLDNGFLSAVGSLDTARRALALHVASPKVEAFHHYYRDHEWPSTPEGYTESSCSSWVNWYGTRVCDADVLGHFIGVETIDSATSSSSTPNTEPTPSSGIENDIIDLLPFDHVNPPVGSSLNPPPKTAILYANMSSPNFRSLHSYLYSASSETPAKIQYVIRFVPPSYIVQANMPLTGYGTILDLKKTEYLAQDDRRRKAQDDGEEFSESNDSEEEVDVIESLLRDQPVFDDKDLTSPLEGDEIPQLGLQASQLIMNSTDPLETLRALSQNFPKYMLSLSRRVNVSDDLAEEIMANQAMIAPGMNVLWLNGVMLQDQDVNPFGLLRLLRKERKIMSSLTALGLNGSEALEVLTHPSIAEAQTGNTVLENMFDASDRLEGPDVIVWWNNLETDTRYSKWPTSLRTLLRPLYPGQHHSVGRNLYNVVFVADLSTRDGLGLSLQLNRIITQNFPVRFGIVPLLTSDSATKVARLFYYLIDNYGRARTMNFIRELVQVKSPTVNLEAAQALYNDLVANNLPDSEIAMQAFDDVVSDSVGSTNSRVARAAQYADRLGLSSEDGGMGHAFVNGKHFPLDNRVFQHIQFEIAAQLEVIQEALFSGEIDDTDSPDMSNYFYDLPTTLKRRNKYIYPTNNGGRLRVFSLPELFSETGLLDSDQDFVYPDGDGDVPVSISVLGDMDSMHTLSLLEQVLSGMTEVSSYRSSFIHVPASESSTALLSSLTLHYLKIEKLLKSASVPDAVNLIQSLRHIISTGSSSEEAQHIFISQTPSFFALPEGKLKEVSGSESYRKAQDVGRMIARKLELQPNHPYLLINGRLIGPIEPKGFLAPDSGALIDFELRRRVTPTLDALVNSSLVAELDRCSKADLVALVSSIVSAAHIPDPADLGIFQKPQSPRNRVYRTLAANHSVFSVGNNETALFHVGAVLDPLSEVSRKWSSLLQWLSGIDGVYLQVHLTPMQNAQIPLKSFYRYNLLPRMEFDQTGAEEISLTTFSDLPIEPIYTLAMETPTAWLVRPKESVYDLDNIQLSTLSPTEGVKGVEASFRLDYLVIEGHSRDPSNNLPTAGLQLQLTDSHGTPVADTMVVANLGYLQLKAPYPGVFGLDIRDERGRQVYYMESAGNLGFNSPNVTDVGNQISLTSLEGLTLYPRFRRHPGMEGQNVFGPSDSKPLERNNPISGVYSKVSSLFWGHADETQEVEIEATRKQADINVFTVASGHLYERLSSIMILSVLRNTQSTVKFWFIENFLSPSFLEFIPHFAREYNFEYELVTYKWPSWLRAQKEKQRIIWAYKILFLDVLFPMDLKKVIFVDADQIMRADLQELVDLDLKGAPYGYTPMGNDNEDMEGFRFWKTGYWKDYLGTLPYHISALYVVDLERFRQIAAGDRLRAHYQALSADPNSLSNLDQDLPNNMQHEIPIFSLHEDWLWCETWCSMERFERAKSIDLCFNPLTKESKLVRARKTPGWIEYDNEIAQFARRLVQEGILHSDVVAADTEVLAQVGKPVDVVEETNEAEIVEMDEDEPSARHDEL